MIIEQPGKELFSLSQLQHYDDMPMFSPNDMIINKLVSHFGSFAKPKFIFQVNHLPKTRSGKLIRRLLRLIIDNPKNKNYGDLSTMINKEIIPHLKKILSTNQNEN